METQISRIAEIANLGILYEAVGPFDKSLDQLNRKGAGKIISGRDMAYSRCLKGHDDWISMEGCFLSHGVLQKSDGESILLINSPLNLVDCASEAAEANRHGKEMNVTPEFYESCRIQAIEDKSRPPSRMRAIFLPDEDIISLSTAENFEVMQSLLHRQIGKYFREFDRENLFFKKFPTREIPRGKIIIKQLWMGGYRDEFDFRADLPLHLQKAETGNLYFRTRGIKTLERTLESLCEEMKSMTPEDVSSQWNKIDAERSFMKGEDYLDCQGDY
jgi:hypothetical protein